MRLCAYIDTFSMPAASLALSTSNLTDNRAILLERREPEGIAGVFDAKDAQKKTVHSQHHRTPNENCNLLAAGVFYARHFQSKPDSSERKGTIYSSQQFATGRSI